ncbi:MAG: hypothetical protein NTY80_02245 [candidate division SR1 bacterium]|nr:hypothetical protein [candidate division SR1 bacterium]
MAAIYVQFKLLVGTETRKIAQRTEPSCKPQNARYYRYFELSNDVEEHLANHFPDKDMINVGEWISCGEKNTHP